MLVRHATDEQNGGREQWSLSVATWCGITLSRTGVAENWGGHSSEGHKIL